MLNVMRCDPFDDRFEHLVRGLLRPLPVAARASGGVQMRIDVSETDESYTVNAEMPGVKKDDIGVSIDGNHVSIGVEVKNEKEVKEGEKVLRSERYYGKAQRSFVLGQDVDEALAQAKYSDGVLTLTLPKKATASARKLTIQ